MSAQIGAGHWERNPDYVVGRPFITVAASISLDPVLVLDPTQYISTASDGVVIGERS